MDPNEALRLLCQALDDGENEEAGEHAENLADWLRAGGFEPDWSAYSYMRHGRGEFPADRRVTCTREWFYALDVMA